MILDKINVKSLVTVRPIIIKLHKKMYCFFTLLALIYHKNTHFVCINTTYLLSINQD